MRQAVLELMRRAFNGIESVDAGSKADLYEAASALLSSCNFPGLHDEAQAAAKAANAIREAAALQQTFTTLLRSTAE